MPLVNTTEMFKKAYEGGYAIGAFNVNNMEIIQGITEAAKELNAPLILQVSAGARKYANHTYLVKLVEAALQVTDLPIALHLDHAHPADADGVVALVVADVSGAHAADLAVAGVERPVGFGEPGKAAPVHRHRRRGPPRARRPGRRAAGPWGLPVGGRA